MLQSILNLNGVQKLNKNKQQAIKGGAWPTNEENCLLCGGEWYFPLCALSANSVCL